MSNKITTKDILVRNIPIEYLSKIKEYQKIYKEKTGLTISQQDILLEIIDHGFKEDLFKNQFNYFYEDSEKTRDEIESLKLAIEKLTANLDMLVEVLLSI
ncbi:MULTISPECIES: hypothetical protein [Aerococcus]|uniref:Uncharacterized protein n=2 Tax=Aerococcus TaxID=1375 RepID=A0A1E9PH40_9LACT|nr:MULTISPECIES: hypothetical protein [Aerococcus]MBU5611108.1 hypothetical protein [Aerococcus urinae]MCY3034021.1 hypothetical protein [Aerococcus mictus]MCY3065789.1 hypothetical protein [Aerococcus mictus]MCY3066455.1 hypothetical protein [Aerococcus mictus]MCY3071380.1 hypothetical protein [Aerococcus mictus]